MGPPTTVDKFYHWDQSVPVIPVYMAKMTPRYMYLLQNLKQIKGFFYITVTISIPLS